MSVTPFSSFNPQGTTALYDCIFQAIHDKMDSKNVALVIITDGVDNDSKLHSFQEIKILLKKQQEKHQWTVEYLFCDKETFKEGGKLNIARMSSFDQKTPGSLDATMRKLSKRLSNFNMN